MVALLDGADRWHAAPPHVPLIASVDELRSAVLATVTTLSGYAVLRVESWLSGGGWDGAAG
jgi:hypothetical protein